MKIYFKIALYVLVSLLVMNICGPYLIKGLAVISLSSAGDILNEEQTTDCIQQVARLYRPKISLTASAVSAEAAIEYRAFADYRDRILNLPPNARFFNMNSKSKLLGEKGVNEIYGLFHCFLFLENKTTTVDVAVISWAYNSGGADNDSVQLTNIWAEDFQELYNRVDVDGMSEKKAARVLGDKWMEETGYVKEK